MVLWKKTAFPLWRAMEKRWKRNVVSRVYSFHYYYYQSISSRGRLVLANGTMCQMGVRIPHVKGHFDAAFLPSYSGHLFSVVQLGSASLLGVCHAITVAVGFDVNLSSRVRSLAVICG